jgi:predicted phage terminase large subunit-like protein
MLTYPSKPAEHESWASWLRTASDAELAQMERDLPLVSPGTFAQLTSQGKWQPARHLVYLDRAILDAIDQAAAGQLDGLVVSMPPQHGKSELCSKYLPAWYLGIYPDRRVILTSYEADFASTWGRKARDVLERHGGIFGVRVSKRSGAVHRWDLDGHDGGMTTAGVGGPITGRGAHLLIIDDPIKNDEEARSATCRQKQWDWWQSVASTRLRPGGLVVVIQTRWHRDDLTGRILLHAIENGQRWRQIKFPAIAEDKDELGRQPGEALWPEMYPAEKLEMVKASRTNYYWAAMYQQNPQAEASAEWPDSFFGPSIWFTEWPHGPACKAVALDPSKGKDAKFGDYSAFVLVAVDQAGTMYVDADLDIRDTSIIVDTALEIQGRFRPDWFGLETNQFQELLATIILTECKNRQVMIPIYTMENTVKKEVRIRRLTPYLARGNIRFKGGSKGARLLVEQLRDFPNGDHDDGPDALEMAIRLIVDQLQQECWRRNEVVGVLCSPEYYW